MVGKEDDPASYWVETVSFQGRIVKLPGGKASKGENHHPKGSLAFFFAMVACRLLGFGGQKRERESC